MQHMMILAVCFAIVWFMPNAQQILGKYEVALGKTKPSRFAFLQWQPTMRWAVATGIIGGFAILDLSQHTEFLYFQF